MTPDTLLHAMCKRHGLAPENGQSLLPLIRRALASPPVLRNRILFLVDGNLAERAKGAASEKRAGDRLDDDVLKAVARVMHGWSPSSDMLELGRRLAEGPDEPGSNPDD